MRSPWGHIEPLVYNNVSDHSSVCIFNTLLIPTPCILYLLPINYW